MKESKIKRLFKSKIVLSFSLVIVLTCSILLILTIKNQTKSNTSNNIPIAESNNTTNSNITNNNSNSNNSTSTDQVKSNENNFDTKGNQTDSNPVPDNALQYFNNSETEYTNGNIDKALELINKAIAMEPADGMFYRKKSEYQISKKDKAGAIKTLEDAIVLLPDDETLKTKLEVIKAVVR